MYLETLYKDNIQLFKNNLDKHITQTESIISKIKGSIDVQKYVEF